MNELTDRIGDAERRLREHDNRLDGHDERINRLEAGQAVLSSKIDDLRQATADMGADVKLEIQKSVSGILRDALNAVPGRVAIWFGILAAAIAVAPVLNRML